MSKKSGSQMQWSMTRILGVLTDLSKETKGASSLNPTLLDILLQIVKNYDKRSASKWKILSPLAHCAANMLCNKNEAKVLYHLDDLGFIMLHCLKALEDLARKKMNEEIKSNVVKTVIEEIHQSIVMNGSKIKYPLLKKLFKPLATLIVNTHIHVTEVTKLLNTLMTGAPRELRISLCRDNANIVAEFVTRLAKCGDFEAQQAITETLLRLSPSGERKIAANNWFLNNTSLIDSFVNMGTIDFDLECRTFINALNLSLGEFATVHTFPCEVIYIGNTRLFKPKCEFYKHLYVDFNMGSKSLSFCSVRLDAAPDPDTNPIFNVRLPGGKFVSEASLLSVEQHLMQLTLLLTETIEDVDDDLSQNQSCRLLFKRKYAEIPVLLRSIYGSTLESENDFCSEIPKSTSVAHPTLKYTKVSDGIKRKSSKLNVTDDTYISESYEASFGELRSGDNHPIDVLDQLGDSLNNDEMGSAFQEDLLNSSMTSYTGSEPPYISRNPITCKGYDNSNLDPSPLPDLCEEIIDADVDFSKSEKNAGDQAPDLYLQQNRKINIVSEKEDCPEQQMESQCISPKVSEKKVTSSKLMEKLSSQISKSQDLNKTSIISATSSEISRTNPEAYKISVNKNLEQSHLPGLHEENVDKNADIEKITACPIPQQNLTKNITLEIDVCSKEQGETTSVSPILSKSRRRKAVTKTVNKDSKKIDDTPTSNEISDDFALKENNISGYVDSECSPQKENQLKSTEDVKGSHNNVVKPISENFATSNGKFDASKQNENVLSSSSLSKTSNLKNAKLGKNSTKKIPQRNENRNKSIKETDISKQEIFRKLETRAHCIEKEDRFEQLCITTSKSNSIASTAKSPVTNNIHSVTPLEADTANGLQLEDATDCCDSSGIHLFSDPAPPKIRLQKQKTSRKPSQRQHKKYTPKEKMSQLPHLQFVGNEYVSPFTSHKRKLFNPRGKVLESPLHQNSKELTDHNTKQYGKTNTESTAHPDTTDNTYTMQINQNMFVENTLNIAINISSDSNQVNASKERVYSGTEKFDEEDAVSCWNVSKPIKCYGKPAKTTSKKKSYDSLLENNDVNKHANPEMNLDTNFTDTKKLFNNNTKNLSIIETSNTVQKIQQNLIKPKSNHNKKGKPQNHSMMKNTTTKTSVRKRNNKKSVDIVEALSVMWDEKLENLPELIVEENVHSQRPVKSLTPQFLKNNSGYHSVIAGPQNPPSSGKSNMTVNQIENVPNDNLNRTRNDQASATDVHKQNVEQRSNIDFEYQRNVTTEDACQENVEECNSSNAKFFSNNKTSADRKGTNDVEILVQNVCSEKKNLNSQNSTGAIGNSTTSIKNKLFLTSTDDNEKGESTEDSFWGIPKVNHQMDPESNNTQPTTKSKNQTLSKIIPSSKNRNNFIKIVQPSVNTKMKNNKKITSSVNTKKRNVNNNRKKNTKLSVSLRNNKNNKLSGAKASKVLEDNHKENDKIDDKKGENIYPEKVEKSTRITRSQISKTLKYPEGTADKSQEVSVAENDVLLQSKLNSSSNVSQEIIRNQQNEKSDLINIDSLESTHQSTKKKARDGKKDTSAIQEITLFEKSKLFVKDKNIKNGTYPIVQNSTLEKKSIKKTPYKRIREVEYDSISESSSLPDNLNSIDQYTQFESPRSTKKNPKIIKGSKKVQKENNLVKNIIAKDSNFTIKKKSRSKSEAKISSSITAKHYSQSRKQEATLKYNQSHKDMYTKISRDNRKLKCSSIIPESSSIETSPSVIDGTPLDCVTSCPRKSSNNQLQNICKDVNKDDLFSYESRLSKFKNLNSDSIREELFHSTSTSSDDSSDKESENDICVKFTNSSAYDKAPKKLRRAPNTSDSHCNESTPTTDVMGRKRSAVRNLLSQLPAIRKTKNVRKHQDTAKNNKVPTSSSQDDSSHEAPPVKKHCWGYLSTPLKDIMSPSATDSENVLELSSDENFEATNVVDSKYLENMAHLLKEYTAIIVQQESTKRCKILKDYLHSLKQEMNKSENSLTCLQLVRSHVDNTIKRYANSFAGVYNFVEEQLSSDKAVQDLTDTVLNNTAHSVSQSTCERERLKDALTHLKEQYLKKEISNFVNEMYAQLQLII